MNVKKIFGFTMKMFLAVVVLAFMGLQSLNFFTFVFPVEQWFYAYLGFGLTSGAVIAYLFIFMLDADTSLRKAVAIGMMIISVLGEVMTAGYGIQLEAQIKTGIMLTQSDYDFMVMVVKLLGFAHGLALLAYFAGDKIIEAFGDADGDGIPNIIDSDYKSKRNNFTAPINQFNSDTERVDPTSRQRPNG